MKVTDWGGIGLFEDATIDMNMYAKCLEMLVGWVCLINLEREKFDHVDYSTCR